MESLSVSGEVSLANVLRHVSFHSTPNKTEYAARQNRREMYGCVA